MKWKKDDMFQCKKRKKCKKINCFSAIVPSWFGHMTIIDSVACNTSMYQDNFNSS